MSRTLYMIGEVALIGTLIFGGVKGYKYVTSYFSMSSLANEVNEEFGSYKSREANGDYKPREVYLNELQQARENSEKLRSF